jgi:hypothetical protein
VICAGDCSISCVSCCVAGKIRQPTATRQAKSLARRDRYYVRCTNCVDRRAVRSEIIKWPPLRRLFSALQKYWPCWQMDDTSRAGKSMAKLTLLPLLPLCSILSFHSADPVGVGSKQETQHSSLEETGGRKSAKPFLSSRRR